MKQKLVEIFTSVVHEVAQKHPVLENYKDELLQTFVERLSENEALVEKYSCLSDDELKDRTQKILESVIENTVLTTVLNRLNAIGKELESMKEKLANEHDILSNNQTVLAEGLNSLARTVGNHSRYIEGQLEEVKREIGEVKDKIDKAKEEISDTVHYLSR